MTKSNGSGLATGPVSGSGPTVRPAVGDPLDDWRNRKLDAAALRVAWRKYREMVGEDPHGTEKQLAAMLELAPRVPREAVS